MNFRTTLVILFIFVALLGMWRFAIKNKSSEDTLKKEKLSERYAVDKDQVSKIRLSYRDKAFVPFSLIKVDDDWKIDTPIQADADDDKVRELLTDLLDKKIKRTMETSGDFAPYGLADPTIRVELWTVGESPAMTLLVGDKAVSYSAYVKEADAQVVHTVESSILDDLTKAPLDMRQRKLLLFTREDVQSLVLSSPGKSEIVLARDGDGWKLESPVPAEADPSEINKIIDAIKSLKAETFEADRVTDFAPYGFAKLTVKVILKETEHQLRLGNPIPETDRIYATVDDTATVFGVDAGSLTQLDRSVFDLRNKRVVDFQRIDVNRFEIQQAGQRIVCAKDTDGTWQIQQPVSLKADNTSVDDLLFEMDSLKVAEFVDDAPTDWESYGLEPARAEIRLYIADEGTPTILKFGNQRGDRIYAKGDKEAIYLVSNTIFNRVQQGVSGLRDRLFWEFDTSDIRQFSLSYDDVQIECTKQGTTWQITRPVNEKADISATQSLLDAVATLRVRRYASVASGAKMPKVRLAVQISLADDTVHTLRLGDSAGPGEIYASGDDDEMLLILPDSLLKDLRKTVEDLRAKVS